MTIPLEDRRIAGYPGGPAPPEGWAYTPQASFGGNPYFSPQWAKHLNPPNGEMWCVAVPRGAYMAYRACMSHPTEEWDPIWCAEHINVTTLHCDRIYDDKGNRYDQEEVDAWNGGGG
jgi:hypothetical protein